ncbi:Sigma-54-dependent Fis family transcriptional regulator [Hyphomicrobiales bacterium]|nr:Sigma-54-dependent Fis family transcriptional regulator [Hyphomicrobiales bacterium]CAH1690386.1 Sigma-54-dependent Fis family transcriptional regulator [Hyphomicrobiales bacterium]
MLPIDQHAARIRTAVESGEAARSALVASWRRCTHGYGLDPAIEQPQRVLTEAEFRLSAERLEPLLFSARATLERMYRSIGGSAACILFAGSDGVPIHWLGSHADADALRQWGVWPGVDWSEQAEGTNGIGTCLVERSPVAIHREQHFYERDIDISCAVAPVFDHVGELAGALDITLYGTATSGMLPGFILAAVTDAARQIEIDHFHHMFQSARVISLQGPARAGAALLAVDADDIILGATRSARQILDLTARDLDDGMSMQNLLSDEPDDFARAERGTLRRALMRTKGNVSAAATALDISRATMKRKLSQYGLRRKP